mmetsp:Transcript_40176/g.48688  ORF Transcript_40176/g.48688 Transcript_40176/m.48688 type:complete len:110 (-) Transcript_40176:1034-1363(-)
MKNQAPRSAFVIKGSPPIQSGSKIELMRTDCRAQITLHKDFSLLDGSFRTLQSELSESMYTLTRAEPGDVGRVGVAFDAMWIRMHPARSWLLVTWRILCHKPWYTEASG